MSHPPFLDRDLLIRGTSAYHGLELFLLKFGLLENYTVLLDEYEQDECSGIGGIAAMLGALYTELSEIRNREDEAEVTIDGARLRINDIGLRMLRPRELFRANGFPDSYIIDPIYNGKPLTITSQVRKCGNSVPRQFAKAIIAENLDALDQERGSRRLAGLPLVRLAGRVEAGVGVRV